MPTVSWIAERVERRREEGQRLTPRVVRCPICGAAVSSETGPGLAMLGQHLALKHPLSRPQVIVNGVPLGAEAVIRVQLHPLDVVIANADEIHAAVNGDHVQPLLHGGLVRLLTSGRKAFIKARLVNRRVADGAESSSELRIRIDIPSSEELDEIDDGFTRYLAHDAPDLDDVRKFAEATNGRDADYVNGLASYVLAVVHKDGGGMIRDAGVLEGAHDEFTRACHLLEPFISRERAGGVMACACFNLNLFTEAASTSGVSGVEAATRYFRSLVEGPRQSSEPEAEAEDKEVVCPIDMSTARVIELFRKVAFALPGIPEAIASTEAVTHWPEDRAKVWALAGSFSHDSHDAGSFERYKNLLANDPYFGTLSKYWSKS